MVLTGIISRGEADFETTDSGCQKVIRTLVGSDTESAPFEEFTFVHRAVEGLCQTASQASSICRRDCGDPCRALPHPVYAEGCAITPGGPSPTRPAPAVATALLVAITLAQRQRRKSRW